MTTIAENTGYLTLIDIFTVAPARQQELIDLLERATDESVRLVPGFVSSALHRSLDGTKVTMYAQWESAGHYQAMRANPVASAYLQQALAIATFEPCMYDVVKTFATCEGLRRGLRHRQPGPARESTHTDPGRIVHCEKSSRRRHQRRPGSRSGVIRFTLLQPATA